VSGSSAVLLDTCALIWIANGIILSQACVAAVRRASRDAGFYVSTARHLGLPVVTSNRKIIEYAKTGNLRVIPC